MTRDSSVFGCLRKLVAFLRYGEGCGCNRDLMSAVPLGSVPGVRMATKYARANRVWSGYSVVCTYHGANFKRHLFETSEEPIYEELSMELQTDPSAEGRLTIPQECSTESTAQVTSEEEPAMETRIKPPWMYAVMNFQSITF
ncbi:hypothetical protein AVEN_136481-1 [Araneus ventricosus]|uniref:Uncharacterized protein n=1 Tax=Araneus ventricosus TaxID=182803 RepID=A0A4Y2QFC1_ARAVE|nr:hypothetical protein AVEN_136481-1 [Araneus ventricosus]